MAFWGLIFLGIVQGVCEFLPISSSGHLVLLSALFGIKDSLLVGVILHVATLAAVVIAFRKDLWQMLKNPFSNQTIFLVISTLITFIMALLILPLLKNAFDGAILPFTFMLSAIILLVTSCISKSGNRQEFSLRHAIIIGLSQGTALLPGLSRSGTTICAGILAGGDQKECAKFSFLLSIPTILGSLLFEIIDLSNDYVMCDFSILGLFISCLFAFVIALSSIKFMMKIVENASFKWFSFYLAVMSITSFVIFY